MSNLTNKVLPVVTALSCLIQLTVPATAQSFDAGAYNPAYSQSSPSADAYSPTNYNTTRTPYRGRAVYVPAGMVLPVTLSTSISTDVARPGDMVTGTLSQNVHLGDSIIPAGSTLIGQVTTAQSGGYLGKAGTLAIKFNRLRTPDGMEAPMSGHIVGGIGKYNDEGGDHGDTFRGETWKTKAGQAAIRGAVGAGTGAALGTAIGAIAARGRARGVGRGAWSGAAIGGGVGVASSLLLRKGKNVVIPSGSALQVQLDAPMNVNLAASTTGMF